MKPSQQDDIWTELNVRGGQMSLWFFRVERSGKHKCESTKIEDC